MIVRCDGMKEQYYLDNASTSWPKPEAVYRAMDETARTLGASPGRGQYALSFEAERLVQETRVRLATFFNHRGGTERVVFALNGTDALNLAIFGLVGEGDHVITTRLEHNSVLRPLWHLQQAKQIELTLVGRDRDGYLQLEQLRQALKRRSKAVIVNHASNVLGSIQDLTEIGALTRAAGARLIVDASQTAGLCTIDMESIGIDLLAMAGHKGMFGPMGIGVLIVGRNVDLVPFRHGGSGVDSGSPRQPERYPYRLEAGTLPLPVIAGLNEALRWFAKRGGQADDVSASSPGVDEACRTAVQQLGALVGRHRCRLEEGLASIEGVVLHGPRAGQPRLATISFNLSGMSAEQVAGMLDADFHVCVRAGLHCAPLVHEDEGTDVTYGGAVRLSPGVFTVDGDVDQALQAVRETAEAARQGTGGTQQQRDVRRVLAR
jgi:cysteine desulfurase family protein